MKAAALLLAWMAALPSSPARITATYSSGGKPIRVTVHAERIIATSGTGLDALTSPLRNLPLWLPPELRAPGSVVYDDGEGLKHDRGREIYVLGSLEKWKGFDALGLRYGYQGMQESDNWTLRACYDPDSGFLLSATVSSRSRASFELSLGSSTDPTLMRKLRRP